MSLKPDKKSDSGKGWMKRRKGKPRRIQPWFLLHFSFMQSDIHRDEYFPKLNEHLERQDAGPYRKNREDIFSVLELHMNQAVANARKLEKLNQGRTPSASAPGTMVHKLVEVLKSYLSCGDA